MPIPNTWPTCTIPGCGHSKSHRDGNARAEAIRENSAAWLSADGTGNATCACHDSNRSVLTPITPIEAFPCDQSARVPA